MVYLFSFPPVEPLAFVQLKQSLSSVSINVLWKWTCSLLTFGCEVRVPPAVQVEVHQESAVGRQITATIHSDAHHREQYFSSAFQPATRVAYIFFLPKKHRWKCCLFRAVYLRINMQCRYDPSLLLGEVSQFYFHCLSRTSEILQSKHHEKTEETLTNFLIAVLDLIL